MRPLTRRIVAVALAGCGLAAAVSTASATPSDRIFGGQEVRDQAKNPGAVLTSWEGKQFCSAMRIGPRWVLSARHCVENPMDGKKYVIDKVYTDSVQAMKGPAAKVKATHIAPIADTILLELEEATPGPVVGWSTDVKSGDQVTYWGWGRTNGAPKGPLSEWLKYATGQVTTPEGKATFYGGVNTYVRGGDGASMGGDSGGPLMKNGKVIATCSWGMAQVNPPFKMTMQGYAPFGQNKDWIVKTSGIAPEGPAYRFEPGQALPAGASAGR